MRLTQRQEELLITALSRLAAILAIVLVAHVWVEDLAWLLASWGINL
jgi:hypothetical protein